MTGNHRVIDDAFPGASESNALGTGQTFNRLIDGYINASRRNPDKTAFVIDGLVYSYQDLAEAEQKASAWLQAQSVKHGLACESLRIACRLRNCFELAVWYLTSVQNNCLFILMDPTWSDSEVQHALDNTLPDILIEHTEPGSLMCREDFCFSTGETLQSEKTFSSAEHLVCARSILNPEGRQTTPDANLFLSGFTSGTSGKPKAFARTAESWLASFDVAAAEFGTDSKSVILAPGPLSHGLSFFALAETFHHGATFVSQESFDAHTCCEFMLRANTRSHRLTAVVLVPSMLVGILDVVQESGFRDGSSTVSDRTSGSGSCRVITAGAKLAISQQTRFSECFPQFQLSEYYGASELSFVSVRHSEENPPSDSVGRVCKRVAVRLLPDHNNIGVIEVAGAMLSSGYLQQQQGQLGLRMITGPEGYSTVGDRGYFDESGFLFLVDREDRMFNCGGLKVFPSRVERVAADYFLCSKCELTVENCVAVGFDDDFWGQRVCLVLQGSDIAGLRDNHQINLLLSYCRSNLQRHEVPRLVVLSETLPMTRSGKVAYQQLAADLTDSLCVKTNNQPTGPSAQSRHDSLPADRWLVVYDADS